ncbi:MAG: 1-acyl-sn-glycerol-3-phosphate acyltransferase [Myxococcales bacterium]
MRQADTETGAAPSGGRRAERPEGAALWLSRFFRAVSFPEERGAELRRLAEHGTLVYVMRSAAALNLAYFDHAYALRGIPVAKVVHGLGGRFWRGFELPQTRPVDAGELAAAVAAGREAMIFLRHAEAFGARGGTPAEDPFPELVRRARAGDRRVFLVPQVLVWGRHPGRLQGGVVDALFGTPDSPNLLRTAGAFLLNYRSATAKVGQAIDLQAYLRDHPDESDALAARKIRGALWQHLARETRVVRGPQLKTPARVAEEVLRDRALKQALEKVAAEQQLPPREVEAQARAALQEIAAQYSPTTIGVLKPALDVIFDRIYDGIEIDAQGMERLRRAAARSSLVLCPSHKSHVDYLILSKVLYDAGLQPPHIAAGANLSFFPLGTIFRKSGAFFLRRSFKGDRLYGAVFRAYVKRLMRDGFSQEFFIEGGRSRTGKLLAPKLGLLSMEVDAWAEGASQDVSFVPIAIDYEKIVEGGAYASELAGGEKQKEDVRGLLRTPQVLRSRYGRIYIQVDEPVSLRDFFRERHLDPRAHTEAERRALVQVLAHRIVWGIARSATVTPASLIAAAVLSHRERGVPSPIMASRIAFLRNAAERGGARLSRVLYEAPSDPLAEGPIQATLKLLCEDGSIRRLEAFGETYFAPNESSRTQLSFYKNNLLQHHVASSLVAAALLSFREGPPSVAAARERTLWLSRLFKFEFVYRVGASFEQIFDETVESLVALGLLEKPREVLRPASIGARERLELLRDLVRDFLEGYWVCAEALAELVSAPEMEGRELVRRALERGRAAFLAGGIEGPEALSRPNLENALLAFADLGYVEPSSEKKLRLAEATRREPSRLRQLSEQIRRFL